MNILIIHNAYQQRGGEDSVVEDEIALLRSHGHNVVVYSRHNDELVHAKKAAAGLDTFWSRQTTAEVGAVIQSIAPDVIHVHNTFPLISPSVYWVAAQNNVPIIQTLHNFRTLCPQAMFLRNQKVCEDCLGKLPWRGVVRSCYRGSSAQSAVLAGMVTFHRVIGTWTNKVTRYIALNDFCRTKFIEGGLPAERLVVKPNFVDFAAPDVIERRGFLFVGRLSVEKGIKTLVESAQKVPAVDIAVAGTGPESELLAGAQNIKALGALSGRDVRKQMSQATALLLPSIWYENFPRTLVEAFGCGLPVIASRIGALAELVQNGKTGLLFEPGNAIDLAEKIRWAEANPTAMARMGLAARAHYEANFTAERNYHQLMTIYQDALAEVRGDF